MAKDATPTESLPGSHVREQILFGGHWFDCPGVAIRNMRHRGIWFDEDDRGCRKRTQPLRQLIWHHTGGERGPEGIYRTLRSRGLSIHFVIHRSIIYQLADVSTVTYHAGHANGTSAGVEMASRGIGKNLAGHNRHEYRDEMHGRRVDYLAFHPAEIFAAQRLAWAFRHVTGIPIAFPAHPSAPHKVLRRQLDNRAAREWVGMLGHCHVSPRKVDPAPDLMDALQIREMLPPSPLGG